MAIHYEKQDHIVTITFDRYERRKRAIGALNPQLDGFDASCFDGVYITGDITPETIARMNAERVDGSEEGGVDVSRLALPNPQEA